MTKKKYDWDLENLLGNNTLEDIFKTWKKNMEDSIEDNDFFCDTKEKFIQRLKMDLDNSILTNKLVNYVSNNLNEDTKNQKWNEWSQKISNEMHNFSKKTSNTSNILLKNEEKIMEYLKDPSLNEYVRDYNLFFKSKHRILPEEQEKLLTVTSKINSGFEDIYSSLVDSTITYEPAMNKNNKLIKLPSMAKVFSVLKSTDRVLRKNTWINFAKSYYENRYILTQTLIYNYKMLNNVSSIRKYESYVEMTADEDEVTVDFIKKIYQGVEDFKNLYKKFITLNDKIIKSTYKIEKLMPWDRSLEVIKSTEKFTIESTQELILKALECFGIEYIEVVKKLFNEQWISWMPKEGKHSGAYSIGGTYGIDKYYISMNFDETINSVYTATHEIGHSLNSYFFGKKQSVHCSCSIFYAEISSITNELVLSYYLLDKAKSKKEKLYIIDKILSGFFSTTTRQIIFSNFEYEIINKELNNEPITYEVIEETYRSMNEKYTGFKRNKKPTIYNKYSSSTILRIDHFYVGNFYVYKYAIGQICAIYIAKKLYDKNSDMLARYFKFLESGSKLSPLDTIKILGIDFNDKEIWEECKANLEYFLKEYEALSKK